MSRCDHGPPDRLEDEPPSHCRACRRERYRATSTRPRRQGRDDKRNITLRMPPALVAEIDAYAKVHNVSRSIAVEDLTAVGIASELVDQALADAGAPTFDQRAAT